MRIDFFALLKWMIVLAVVAVAALIGYQFFFPAERPQWVGIFIVLALIGVGIGILFLRRLWARGKEHRLSEQEEARIAAEIRDDKVGLKSLQNHWNQAIHFLRQSPLKKKGDPLYVLPWYLVIGDKESGKTTAIHGARLASFSETAARSVTATQDCEWSFFESAIVIDTAGRYLAPVLEERDREEWQRLLDLLFKYRKQESLNGLVVALSAEKLLSGSAKDLEDAGQLTRKRIDELMRALGAKCPVYVLVTKCDRVRGMAGFFEHLSESGRDQPMGALNSNPSGSAVAFTDSAFRATRECLNRLRLVIAHQDNSRAMDADMFIFPDAFSDLQKGVGAFVRGAFQENIYQETPLLRGLFFSGGAGRGFFLHDFFAKVLPADRSLFIPTQRALEWRKGTLTMGLTLWLILATAIGGLMTYSFAMNLGLLHQADQAFAHLPAAQGNPQVDILVLDQWNQAILSLTESRRGAWLNVFGLHEVGRVKQAMKEKLSRQFSGELLPPFDVQIGKSMAALNASSDDFAFSQYIEHLIGRITLLRARLRGETLESDDNRQPPMVPFLRSENRETSADVKQKFARLYLSYVFWLPDTTKLNQELVSLQALLKRLLALKAGAPHWVIEWAQRQESGSPVTLGDYWGGGAPRSSSEPSVPAIFSRKDKKLLDSFFNEIESGLNDQAAYTDLKSQFEHWYRINAFDAWRRFMLAFPEGAQRLRSRAEWRQTVAKMAKDEGPYFALLNNSVLELEPLAGKDAPPWLGALYQFQLLKGPQAAAGLSSRLGLRVGGKEIDLSTRMAASEALIDYRKALEKVVDTVVDPSQIVQATGQAFQEGSGPGSSAFAAAFNALAKLKGTLAGGAPIDPAIWTLIAGPLDFLWDYARRETGDRLQTEWEQKVLATAAGIARAEVASTLLSQDGPAVRFAKEDAASFLEWKPGRGYYAKSAFGGAIPFTRSFLSFVNSGAKGSSAAQIGGVNVTITALAPETNPGSKRIPHSTLLELTCGGTSQILAIRRQRLMDQSFNVAQKSFNWSSACTDMTLEIDISDRRLIKRYPGKPGFFNFLKDFEGGTHTFSPIDFPNDSSALSEMGIDWITIPYRIVGAPASMPDFSKPDPVPSRIVQGWGG